MTVDKVIKLEAVPYVQPFLTGLCIHFIYFDSYHWSQRCISLKHTQKPSKYTAETSFHYRFLRTYDEKFIS